MELNQSMKKMLYLLFTKGPASRKTLAQEIGITTAAVTQMTSYLLESSYIVELGEVSTMRVGRKELLLGLNPKKGYFLGLEIKKSSFKISMIDFAGKKVLFERFTNQDKMLLRLQDLLSHYDALGLGVLSRGYKTKEGFQSKNRVLYEALEQLPVNKYYMNNVECLALIYRIYHQQDTNFLLLKYGPGVGSAFILNGKMLQSEYGLNSEVAHFQLEDQMLENVISYDALFGRRIDEEEGYQLLLSDEEKMNLVLQSLAKVIVNIDFLLSLDTYVLSGTFFADNQAIERLKAAVRAYSPDFRSDKLISYPDFVKINDVKGSLAVFYHLFGTLSE